MSSIKKVIKVFIGSICCLLFLGEPAYAGSLNANEQELVSIIKGTYTYKGITYKVKDTYIQVAIDYLLQDDIDVTDEQKRKAINKMYSSVQQGIDEGYLEAVDGKTAVMGGSVTRKPDAESETPEGKAAGKGATASETRTDAVGDAAEVDLDGTPDETVLMETSPPETTKAAEILSLERYADEESPLLPDWMNVPFLPMPRFPWRFMRRTAAMISAGILLVIIAAMRAGLFVHHRRSKRGELE